MRIPFFVGEDLRWFEESVCEMASHFFLRKLSLELTNEKYNDYLYHVFRECQSGHRKMLRLDNMKVILYQRAGREVCPAFGENF